MRVQFRVFYGFHKILGFCAFFGFREFRGFCGFLRFLEFCDLCGSREFLGLITSSELTELDHVSFVLIYVVNFSKSFG
jgi:hypothetical protein